MEKTHIYIIRRYLLLLAGLAIMAFGVAFSIKASLGTSPISSVPYVVSLFAPLTVGTATIIMHCVFILLQILILRKKYHPIQLMQLPVAFFFGYLTDFGVWAVQGITCDHYLQQWLVCLIGIFLVAVGVSLEVKAGVVVLAGEGVVLAICKVLPVKFGYMKVGFDVDACGGRLCSLFCFYRETAGRQGRNRRRGAAGGPDRETAWENAVEVETGGLRKLVPE